MDERLERARAYLAGLEAERQATLVLSEQKAEEAKLIKARQEGFQAAIEILGCKRATGSARSDPKELGRRRGRWPVPQLILRELSFSGQARTVAQIARAIDYLPDRTETALKRMEKAGQVLRNEGGRWAIALAQPNGHAVSGGMGNPAHRSGRDAPRI
jgi:hypothetical protein